MGQSGHPPSTCLRLLLLLALLGPVAGCAVGGPGASTLTLGRQAYYALRVRDQVIGYCTYQVTGRERQGGRDLYTVASSTVLQVDVAGQTQTVRYCATTQLDPDYVPERYELRVEHSGGVPAQITAERAAEAWRLTLANGGERQERELPLSEATYLLDNNLFEQSAFLLAALRLQPGESRAVRVLVPQMLTGLTLELSAAAAEEQIAVSGAPVSALRVTVSGEQLSTMLLWVTAAGELVRLEIPAQNVVVEPADERVLEQVSPVELAAFMQGRSTPSNVQFSAYWNVDRLVLRLDAKVVGEELDAAFLSDARQTFTGTAQGGWVRGTVEARRLSYPLQGSPAFPLQGELDPALAAYLRPEEGVECDDPVVAAKARELASGAATTGQAARAVADWVHRNIAYEVTAGGARACLGNMRGDCGPQTRLVIAMCRALGIPARMVGGLMYSEGRFGQHYWAEVWLGEAGWVPFDATAGELAELDATHIRLWQMGTVEELEVEVLGYDDRGLAQPLPRRSLGLQAGERHTYAFFVDGALAGSHTWQVLGEEALDGRQAWHLQATLDASATRQAPEGQPLLLLADLWVDDEAGPLRYEARAQVGQEAPATEASFSEGSVHEAVSAHGQRVEKDVALPAEVYILPNNLVACQALIYRSLQLEPGQSLLVPLFLPESLAVQAVHMNVGPELETVTMGERRYQCLVVQVAEFRETDYVTPEGLLVRIALPTQGTLVDLVESPPAPTGG